MQKFPEDWSDGQRISFLQRKIIINSICYYVFDKTLITDNAYDEISKQLADMTKEYTGESQYKYCMFDYDGSSGFDIYDRLNEADKDQLTNIAYKLAFGDGIRSKRG